MKFKNTPRLTCLLLILSGWIALFGGVTFFMKIIEINSPTYGLKQVFVDDEDFDRINKFKWTLKKSHNTFYARRSSKSPTWILMHREIINVDDKSIHYDHVDTNGLNNQKINLRRCNHSQNGANKPSLKGSSSVYKGVCFRPKRNKYQAAIQIRGSVKFLGMFFNEIDAAKAYDNAAKIHHGEFANLNFK